MILDLCNRIKLSLYCKGRRVVEKNDTRGGTDYIR